MTQADKLDGYLAELDQVAERLGLTVAPELASRLTAFRPWLAHYLEFQLKLNPTELNVVTMGQGAAYEAQLGHVLAAAGGSPRFLTIFNAIQQAVTGASWGLKFATHDPHDVQTYLKKPVPLAILNQQLRSQQIAGETALEKVAAVARILDKKTTHFFGLDVCQDESIPLQIYFTQYSAALPTVQSRLAQVARIVGLDEANIAQLQSLVTTYAGKRRTIFLSVTISSGTLLPTLKLDFSSPRLAAILPLYTPEEQWQLQELAQLLSVYGADYLGLRLSNGRPLSKAIYLTRIR